MDANENTSARRLLDRATQERYEAARRMHSIGAMRRTLLTIREYERACKAYARAKERERVIRSAFIRNVPIPACVAGSACGEPDCPTCSA